MVDLARRVLNMCCPDVWIYADHFKGEQAGKSPGFGLSLFAETIKGSNGVARFQLDVLFSRRLGYTLRTFKF